MLKNTVTIEGMACGMCEAHINDTIRKAFPSAKKVSSSHKSGTSTFITEAEIDESRLKSAIDETGYKFISIASEPYEKKPFWKK